MEKNKIFNSNFIEIKYPLKEIFNKFTYEKFPFPEKIKNIPVIYFLLDRKENILYIGSTKTFRTRLCAHLSPYSKKGIGTSSWVCPKKVKQVLYLEVKEEELKFLEEFYLYFYETRYNHKGFSYNRKFFLEYEE